MEPYLLADAWQGSGSRTNGSLRNFCTGVSGEAFKRQPEHVQTNFGFFVSACLFVLFTFKSVPLVLRWSQHLPFIVHHVPSIFTWTLCRYRQFACFQLAGKGGNSDSSSSSKCKCKCKCKCSSKCNKKIRRTNNNQKNMIKNKPRCYPQQRLGNNASKENLRPLLFQFLGK